MKKLGLIAFCCLSASAFAQNQNLDFKYGIKLSNTSSYESSDDVDFYSRLKTTEIFHPSASFLVKTKHKNFHEFELTDLSLNSEKYERTEELDPSNPNNAHIVKTHIGIQYQYVINFLKKKDSRWMPSLGLGIKSEYTRLFSSAYDNSTIFQSSTNTLTFTGIITPAINYNISKRFFASFSVPVYVYKYSAEFTKYKNPNLPIDQQSISTNTSNAFPTHFGFKLGVGIKL